MLSSAHSLCSYLFDSDGSAQSGRHYSISDVPLILTKPQQLAEVKYAARKQIQNDIYQHEQDLADTGLASTLAVANAGEALRESLQDIDDDIANMQELRSGLLVIGERADTPMLQLFAKNLSEQIVKVEQQLRVFNQRRGNIQRKYDECIEDIKKKEGMVGAWCKERIDQYKNSIKVVAYKVDEVEEELVSVVSEAFDMSKAIGPGEAVKAKLGNEMDPLVSLPHVK